MQRFDIELANLKTQNFMDLYFQVVGMVTRKDLARYRVWKHYGKTGVEELKIL